MKTLLIPLALVAIAASAPASAQQDLEVRSTTVRYSDLELATPKGQAALDRRVALAIHQVCDDPSTRSLEASADERACRDEARRQARTDVTRLAMAATGTAATRKLS